MGPLKPIMWVVLAVWLSFLIVPFLLGGQPYWPLWRFSAALFVPCFAVTVVGTVLD